MPPLVPQPPANVHISRSFLYVVLRVSLLFLINGAKQLPLPPKSKNISKDINIVIIQ